MKKLLTGALVFSLALGFFFGSVLTLPEKANAANPVCVLEPESFWWMSPTDPDKLCDNPPLPVELILPIYQCEGYWSHTGLPCQCVFIACGQIAKPIGPKLPAHN